MKHVAAFISAAFLSIIPAFPESATTPPVGYVMVGAYDSTDKYLGCLGSSDTAVALPLTRDVAFRGAIAAISGSTLTVMGNPGWAQNQFVHSGTIQRNSYYVLIGGHATSSPKEGSYYFVDGNGPNTLTVDLNGDSLGGVLPSTQISVIPYWTLNTVFPAAEAGKSFNVTVNTGTKTSIVQIPNYDAGGTNPTYTNQYYFYNGAWRLTNRPTTEDRGDDILEPNGYFRFRNNLSPGTSLALVGSVLTGKLTTPLTTGTSTQQGTPAGLARPVKVMLDSAGLISSGAFAPSLSSTTHKDELLVFENNTSVGIYKSPNATYYYYNNAWRKVGKASTLNTGTTYLPLGAALFIRKAPTANGVTQFWQNSPTY